MSQALSCPKCNGEMVQGFVADYAHYAHGSIRLSQWTEGAPNQRTFFGFKNPNAGINMPKTGESIPIGTFRCQSCGYLESYAREEFAEK